MKVLDKLYWAVIVMCPVAALTAGLHFSRLHFSVVPMMIVWPVWITLIVVTLILERKYLGPE